MVFRHDADAAEAPRDQRELVAKYASSFGLVAAALASMATLHQGWSWLLLWPAMSFAIVALAYLGLGPRVFGKRPDGSLNPIMSVVLLPYLLLTWTSWYLLRVTRREPAFHEIVPGFFVGRRLLWFEQPPPVDCVVDLTCEFSETKLLRRKAAYRSFPILDGAVPRVGPTVELVKELGQPGQSVFIHCAEGHGRTGTMAALLLLARGEVATPERALQLVRSHRPLAELNPRQRQFLVDMSTRLRSDNSERREPAMPLTFDAHTMDYSPANALFLGKAARLAYESQATIEQSGREELCLKHIKFFDVAGTQVFVGATDELIVVAFRGTEPKQIEDWLADAMVAKTPGPRGEVHAGFQIALDSVWEEVRSTIDRYQDHGQSLWFTGHSLGAALATLSTARLRLDENKPVHGLYTFGSPRVGDHGFADALDVDFGAHAFRFVNNQDIVTRVPPRQMGYSHIGTVRMFDKNGDLVMLKAMWLDFLEEFVDDAMEWIREAIDKHIVNRFEDHSMDTYVRFLERHAASVGSEPSND